MIKDKILFGQISKWNSDKSSSFPVINLIEGGFYLGTKEAINNFETNFWEIHDERFDKGLFIGKDQIIMNIISSTKSNETVRLQTWNLNCKNTIDFWFFYQYFLSSNQFYECIQPREQLLII